MNWTDFIRYTAILYFIYYAVNILTDLLRAVKQKSLDSEDMLIHFSEEVQPIVVGSPHLSEEPQEDADLSLEHDGQENQQWERGESDTEELVLREENIAETTGGVFKMEELIPLAKAKTIVYTENLVF